MNRSVYEKMAEARRSRPLHPDEEAELAAYFAANPEARANWEADLQVDSLLRQLPDAPVSSNFTAQVLQRIQREEAQSSRTTAQDSGWLQRLGLWRWTATAAVAALCVVSFQRYEFSQREELAQSAAEVSAIALPALDFIKDFDAINGVRQAAPTPKADEELLLALQ